MQLEAGKAQRPPLQLVSSAAVLRLDSWMDGLQLRCRKSRFMDLLKCKSSRTQDLKIGRIGALAFVLKVEEQASVKTVMHSIID